MTDLTYMTLQDAIPRLDSIITAASHDRRCGWSDRAIYQTAVDGIATSGATYRLQRLALDLFRAELNIPDSIEDRRVAA